MNRIPVSVVAGHQVLPPDEAAVGGRPLCSAADPQAGQLNTSMNVHKYICQHACTYAYTQLFTHLIFYGQYFNSL